MDFEEDDDYEAHSSSSDDEGIAMDSNGVSDSQDKQRDYRVIKQDELLAEMNRIALETSSVIGFPAAICRILLHHYKWNKETLLEKFFEASDMDAFFRSANLIDPKKAKKTKTVTGNCTICYERRQLTGLPCGHYFCLDCWNSYLENKIADEGHAYLPCPEYKCSIIIDDDTALNLIKSPNAKLSYNKLVTNSFVESNPLMKWCPGRDCGRIIKVPHAECRAVTCDCGSIFCFACSQAWHEPVGCDLLKRWLKKCNDDSETSNWLNANTKDCPKCQITIEKDGGCNHMTCKNVSCRFEFCWMCLGPWGPHGSGWYSCNRYDDSAAKQARDAQERSRAALQRYLHYYNRYMNHQNSLKLEKKLYAQVHSKMEQMQQHNFSWIETQFLKNAVDVLSECRRTLMYTYAFAFYLAQNNVTKIFEDNQQDLELSTEQLSEFLERDLDSEDLVTLKQKVQDKYRYVEHRRNALLKHCAEGNEKGEWKYNADSEL
jgi:ariadne-1